MNTELERKLKIKREIEERNHKTLKKVAKDNVREQSDKKAQMQEYYDSLTTEQKEIFNKEREKRKVIEHYATYLKYVYPDYYFTNFHKFLVNICESVVKKIENGEKARICISVPPRHGKSLTFTETLPSWFLCRNPDKRVIITGYNADIAEKFGDKNRQTFRQYGNDLCHLEISDSQDNKTLFDIKGHKGGCLSVGILGGITGMGGNLIIVDDPFKNGEEADNPSIRDRVFDVFRDSVLSRLEGKGNACIVIHTRWNEDDLIGRLEKTGDWLIVNIPAVCDGEDRFLHREIGQTLCPELGFDVEWAIQTEKALGKRKWSALYQGKPFVENGDMVKRTDIKYYTKTTLPSVFDEIVLSCDLSFGGKKQENDPCCMSVFGRLGGNHYLLTCVMKKLSFPEQLENIRRLCARYPQMRKKLIEKKANGNAVIDTLNNEIGGFVPFDPLAKNKEERLSLCLPYIESGNVFLPDPKDFPLTDELTEQLVRFPKVTHDDFVDTLTQYLLNYDYKGTGKVQTDSYFVSVSKAFHGIKF